MWISNARLCGSNDSIIFYKQTTFLNQHSFVCSSDSIMFFIKKLSKISVHLYGSNDSIMFCMKLITVLKSAFIYVIVVIILCSLSNK